MESRIAMHACLLAIFLSLFLSLDTLAAPPINYDKARKIAQDLWLKNDPTTFYCGCGFRESTPAEKKVIRSNLIVITDDRNCGYQVHSKTNSRAKGIWMEHIVPASWMVEKFCGRESTRKECQEESDEFNSAEGDLFNLVPTIAELNKDRDNYPYGIISDEVRVYGNCDFEVDEQSNTPRAEPKESIRGDLARATFYMIEKYDLKDISRIDKDYLYLMIQWNNSDPIDDEEKMHHDWIAEKMGWCNKYVVKEEDCVVDLDP